MIDTNNEMQRASKFFIIIMMVALALSLSSSLIVSAVTTTSTSTAPITTTTKTIYLFNLHIPDANETKLGIPADLFAPDSITVTKGDIITIKFFNTEKDEPHTFTIGAPYNIDRNVAAGQNSTIIFKANYQGIFSFYCKYHLPTMQGQLIVLPRIVT